MSKFWSDAIKHLVPYVPGEQPKDLQIVKLNTNENPYPPSPRVMQTLQNFEFGRLRLYPDPDARALKQALADYHGVARDNIFVGNGSDEVLAHTFMAFFRQSAPLLMPNISYSFYDVYCNLYDIQYQEVPLREDFSICLDDYSQTNGGIIFANPNAPTGCILSLDEIEQLLQRNTESVVVVDEAYVDFGAQSAVALTQRYENLLVVQTFSKSRSLAGLRIGFAIGHPDLIDGLERVKNSFNSYPLDMLAISAGVAALEDEDYFRSTTDRIIATREWTCNELHALGFIVLPSGTNFVFAQHRYLEGAELMGYLRANGLLVRHFSRPLISNHLRISIGTDAEMQQLIETLGKHPDIIRL